MWNSKTIRTLMVLAFSSAILVGFAGCDAFEEAGDEMDDDLGQIEQTDQMRGDLYADLDQVQRTDEVEYEII